jgi:hypothetical protein
LIVAEFHEYGCLIERLDDRADLSTNQASRRQVGQQGDRAQE